MKYPPILLALQLVTFAGASQSYVEVAKVYYQSTTTSKFKNSGAKTKVDESGIDLTVPFKISGRTYLITGAGYDWVQTKIDALLPEQTFSGFFIKAGILQPLSDNASLTILMLPRWSANSFRVDKNAFQMGMFSFLKFSMRTNLNYRAGLYYNREFFGPLIVPLFGVYYKTDNLEVNAMLPMNADVAWKLASKMSCGLFFNGQIRSFSASGVVEKEAYVVKSANELSACLKFTLTDRILLRTSVGYALSRTYRMFEQDDKIKLAVSLVKFGDDRQQLNDEFKTGMIFQGQLGYRVPTR